MEDFLSCLARLVHEARSVHCLAPRFEMAIFGPGGPLSKLISGLRSGEKFHYIGILESLIGTICPTHHVVALCVTCSQYYILPSFRGRSIVENDHVHSTSSLDHRVPFVSLKISHALTSWVQISWWRHVKLSTVVERNIRMKGILIFRTRSRINSRNRHTT